MKAVRFAFLALALSAGIPAEAQAQVQVQAERSHSADHNAASVSHRTKGDPFERFNRHMFALNQTFDRAVFGPLAITTAKVIPKPVRNGLRNFLHNLSEAIVFFNDILQLKPKRALRTLARFTVNSTVGVAGLFDVAKSAKLPHRNNGFGNTLAHYGVGPGPYLFLPLVGPTTIRDFGATQIDRAVLPLAVGKPFNRLDWQLGTGIFSGLNQRIDSDEDLRNLLSGAADPYATLRSVYLQSRAAEIAEIDGATAAAKVFDDPLDDPAIATPKAETPRAEPPVAEPDAAMPSPKAATTPPDAADVSNP